MIHTRLALGLSNPNKAAALVCWLALLVWALPIFFLRYRSIALRLASWHFAFVISFALNLCLLGTESRGGILALMVGSALLLAYTARPWPKWKIGMILTTAPLLAAFSIYYSAHSRMTPGYVASDPSVHSRLTIWKSTPAMIADAPMGWGIDQAGPAYCDWYQSVGDAQRFRVLISTHLTSLVEFPWWGRLAYLAFWSFALILVWRHRKTTFGAVALALTASTGVAMQFSCVGEAWWTWPGLGIAIIIAFFAQTREPEWKRTLLHQIKTALIAATLFLSLILVFGFNNHTAISKKASFVHHGGQGKPILLITGSVAVVSPKDWRTYALQAPLCPPLLWLGNATLLEQNRADTRGATAVVVAADRESLRRIPHDISTLIFLAPKFTIADLPETFRKTPAYIINGELSSSLTTEPWAPHVKICTLEGIGDFIPDWAERVTKIHADRQAAPARKE